MATNKGHRTPTSSIRLIRSKVEKMLMDLTSSLQSSFHTKSLALTRMA
ncbi:hypothetical protein CCACVL1_21172 [Corchorus capsularis]|uniref:Uncharacterized protein n=1 Tax=Corchorus capsularis TaxID=210143 RepID=A0A1R3H808_COCAP|nr:hypothetical protein CCACVL1_21172 [Corchorus capsularis]